VHVIPSCEIPSFCTTDASSHTGNARLEPHIGNAGESVAGILTEKSRVTWHPYPGSYRPRIRTGYVAFFKKLLGSPAGFGFARSAAEFECEESAYPNTPDPRRYCLASATSSTTILARSEYTCAHSCLRCNSLFAPAQSLAGSL
jgi:hypothetical protein